MTWRVESTPLTSNSSLMGVVDRGVRLSDGLDSSFVATGAARANLDKLLTGKALCVTTGQQPGLLTGPVMTIHKALAAAALAARCSESMGVDVVPVFWVAGDDHDFAESGHLQLISMANEVERIELRTRPDDAPATPLFREPLGSDITAVFERVRSSMPNTEFRDAQLERFTQHYTPDQDLASAFAHTLAELLGDHGVIVFQPYTAGAKAAAAPILKAAISRARAINTSLIERSHALESAGQPVPVPVHDDHTLVMYEGSMGRDRLLLDGDGFHLRRSGERFSQDELLQLVDSDLEKFSANVLLRPVTEGAALPTIAYVAGPTEARYWEQADVVFDELDVRRHPVVTRWSGRVVENRVEKVLEKYSLVIQDLALPEGQLESRLVRDTVPDPIEKALHEIRGTIDQQIAVLIESAVEIEPTLEKPTEHARKLMFSQLDHIERKIVSQLKQRNDVLLRQVGTARTAMFPLHKPQERVINVLHYLVRHGPEYLHGLMGACQDWAAGFESPVNIS